ncbi:MAG TPA: ABC transporter ATP-binding protein [Vicinamibacterales bacterium]|nr:ABC transporter ATP-binding protein [Vicinamibacterales bacterium]
MSEVTLDDVRVEREGRLVLDVRALTLRAGRTTAILGPNGSGKTTLLRAIAGLERPQSGRIRIGGSRIAPRHLAYVFQEEVFLRQSVRRNLELGLRLRGEDNPQIRVRVEDAAARTGITHLLERRADRLSGGEARRANLARAFCLHAPLVLLDEPLAGLDGLVYSHLVDELPRIVQAFRATTVLVTHNRDEALRLSDDLVVLIEGRVHAAGAKHDVATNPRSAGVAGVLGYTVLMVDGTKLAVPPGAIKAGGGPNEFTMTIDAVVDAVDFTDVIGAVDGVRVRVRWGGGELPAVGQRVAVHAARSYELE